jgi:CMP-N-acetylneuraminic acid synthetase
MVPAKLGSTRLVMKNLALIEGKPLIYYAIKAAKESGIFDRVVINAEDGIFEKIARRYGVDFYLRPGAIVGPTTKTDTVVYDFLRKNPCDIVAWVSPIAPFQTAGEIREMTKVFLGERLDTLMTVKEERVHCVCKGKPVNFRSGEIFAQTQDLQPVKTFVYSVMMWRSVAFMKMFEKKGYAILCGKVGYFTVGKTSAMIIKKQEDLMMAGCMKKALNSRKGHEIRYDRVVRGLDKRR